MRLQRKNGLAAIRECLYKRVGTDIPSIQCACAMKRHDGTAKHNTCTHNLGYYIIYTKGMSLLTILLYMCTVINVSEYIDSYFELETVILQMKAIPLQRRVLDNTIRDVKGSFFLSLPHREVFSSYHVAVKL